MSDSYVELIVDSKIFKYSSLRIKLTLYRIGQKYFYSHEYAKHRIYICIIIY